MTYLAPRQGQFATLLLISFCLHCVFFVISADGVAKKQSDVLVQQLSAQLTDELQVPLQVNDKVAMAVISQRYQAVPSVDYIGVYKNDELLAQAGELSETSGTTLDVSSNTQVLGQVMLKTTTASRAGVIANYWLFLLASLVLHGMLWMIYGYIARPSKQNAPLPSSTNQLANLPQSLTNPTNLRGDLSGDSSRHDSDHHSQSIKRAVGLNVNEFLKNKLGNKTSNNQTSNNQTNNNGNTDSVWISVVFHDKHGTLPLLIEDKAAIYFALCDELLDKTLQALLGETLLAGVAVAQIQYFDQTGAVVELQKTSDTAKVALAGAMLAKLLVLVNEVVYQKQRELSQFGLPIKAIAYSNPQLKPQKLLYKHPKPSLICFDNETTQMVAKLMNLESLPNPTNAYEKKCYAMTALSNGMANQLTRLRKQVLTAPTATQTATQAETPV